jgi:hypothetical protein
MDDLTIGIVAFIFYICILALSVWRNRNTPGFWSAEAIRARGRHGIRMIAFGTSLVGVMVCVLSSARAPIWFGAWAIGFTIVAWLFRPRWMRAKRCVNRPATNPDGPSESN